MFQQPAEAPDADEHGFLMPGHPNPFDPAQMQELIALSTEELGLALGALPTEARIPIIRDLHDTRKFHADQRHFEEEVELVRDRKRARHEADRRDAEDRERHLTSPEGRAAAAAAFEAELIDLEDIPDPEPIIDGFLHRDSLVRTFGQPKSLKSFVTLDMAASVSLGKPWQGRETHRTTVLYIVAEGLRGVKKRRDAWNEHHGTKMEVIFYPKAVQIGDQDEMYRLIAFCLSRQVGYVVFDTQARCTVGVEENDNTEMGEIVAALDILKRETGACVHMVHHSVGSDPKKARGATAWDGAVDAEFYTQRDANDPERVKLVTKFQKDIPEAEKVLLLAREVGASLVLEREDAGTEGGGGTGEVAPALVSEPLAVYLEAVRDMHGPCTRTDVFKILKEKGTPRSDTAVKSNINKLIATGALEARGASLILTQPGLVYLDRRRKNEPAQGSFEGSPGNPQGNPPGNLGQP